MLAQQWCSCIVARVRRSSVTAVLERTTQLDAPGVVQRKPNVLGKPVRLRRVRGSGQAQIGALPFRYAVWRADAGKKSPGGGSRSVIYKRSAVVALINSVACTEIAFSVVLGVCDAAVIMGSAGIDAPMKKAICQAYKRNYLVGTSDKLPSRNSLIVCYLNAIQNSITAASKNTLPLNLSQRTEAITI